MPFTLVRPPAFDKTEEVTHSISRGATLQRAAQARLATDPDPDLLVFWAGEKRLAGFKIGMECRAPNIGESAVPALRLKLADPVWIGRGSKRTAHGSVWIFYYYGEPKQWKEG